jgi:hypothetical protein
MREFLTQREFLDAMQENATAFPADPQLVDVLEVLASKPHGEHQPWSARWVVDSLGREGKPPGRDVFEFRKRIGFRLAEAVCRGYVERVRRPARRRVFLQYRITPDGERWIDG